MSSKLQLTKIALETKDGKKVELTIDEAKELHEQLHSLFGEKIQYVPSAPLIIERDRWQQPYRPYYWYDQVTCGSSSTKGNPDWCGNEILCSTSGDSGLSVSYCGNAL